jgi:peptidoglycan/xylan/chitin deacetylase (PgdA/CDA1 family)
MNLSWLLPSGKGIPVLMYHKVWNGKSDKLTITPERLREHWIFLKDQGYHTLSLQEYLEIVKGEKPPADKSILITFDDGYRNNLVYAYPMLREFGMKATFFIITDTLVADTGGLDGEEQKMSLNELRLFDPAIVQLAIHGFEHLNMSEINFERMKAELINSLKAFEYSGLIFSKVFAYPYGARPLNPKMCRELKRLMGHLGIEAAFRIGNKVSKIPAQDIFEIRRIDINGTDRVHELKIKLKKGKLKPF